MSVQATAWAWEQEVSQNVKLLLLFLAESADRYGRGPMEAIEDAPNACGFDSQTLTKHLQTLEETGLLEVAPGEGYTLPKVPFPKRGGYRWERPR
jgi:DNA-binding PadR family transcriptional regulator